MSLLCRVFGHRPDGNVLTYWSNKINRHYKAENCKWCKKRMKVNTDKKAVLNNWYKLHQLFDRIGCKSACRLIHNNFRFYTLKDK